MAQRRQDIAKLLEPLLSLPANSPRTVSPPPSAPTKEDVSKPTNDPPGAQQQTTSDLKKPKRKQGENAKPTKRRKKEASITIDNFI